MESSGDGNKKGTVGSDDKVPEQSSREQFSESLNAERESFRQVLDDARARGFDVDEWLIARSAHFVKALPIGAQADFFDLCESGCHPVTLAGLAAFLEHGPRLQTICAAITGTGSAEDRSAAARKLEKATGALEGALGESTASVDEGAFAGTGQVHPRRLASELRTRAQMMMFPTIVAEFTGAHSPLEFSRYLLAEYVERVTGSPRDRAVSGLIAALCADQLPDCSADDQRVWRYRNYERLDPSLSLVVDYILMLSTLLAS